MIEWRHHGDEGRGRRGRRHTLSHQPLFLENDEERGPQVSQSRICSSEVSFAGTGFRLFLSLAQGGCSWHRTYFRATRPPNARCRPLSRGGPAQVSHCARLASQLGGGGGVSPGCLYESMWPASQRSNPGELVLKYGSFKRENTNWSLRPSPYCGFGGVGKEGWPELGVTLLGQAGRSPTSCVRSPTGKESPTPQLVRIPSQSLQTRNCADRGGPLCPPRGARGCILKTLALSLGPFPEPLHNPNTPSGTVNS